MTRTLLAAIALCAAIGAAHAETISGQASVIDGDTIVINGQHIRLAGIDAPEKKQTCGYLSCGETSKEKLIGMVNAGTHVVCDSQKTDRYGRTVAACLLMPQGSDIGDWMVRYGWAVRYPQYDPECRYCIAEAEAREAKRGLWAGEFEMPWIWRREHKGHGR